MHSNEQTSLCKYRFLLRYQRNATISVLLSKTPLSLSSAALPSVCPSSDAASKMQCWHITLLGAQTIHQSPARRGASFATTGRVETSQDCLRGEPVLPWSFRGRLAGTQQAA